VRMLDVEINVRRHLNAHKNEITNGQAQRKRLCEDAGFTSGVLVIHYGDSSETLEIQGRVL
jgi:hypothetical protein